MKLRYVASAILYSNMIALDYFQHSVSFRAKASTFHPNVRLNNFIFVFNLQGFGAKLPPSGQLSFQFPLNGNAEVPYCSDVNEIITHYRDQLHAVELYGPTNFAPVNEMNELIYSNYFYSFTFFPL